MHNRTPCLVPLRKGEAGGSVPCWADRAVPLALRLFQAHLGGWGRAQALASAGQWGPRPLLVQKSGRVIACQGVCRSRSHNKRESLNMPPALAVHSPFGAPVKEKLTQQGACVVGIKILYKKAVL